MLLSKIILYCGAILFQHSSWKYSGVTQSIHLSCAYLQLLFDLIEIKFIKMEIRRINSISQKDLHFLGDCCRYPVIFICLEFFVPVQSIFYLFIYLMDIYIAPLQGMMYELTCISREQRFLRL